MSPTMKLDSAKKKDRSIGSLSLLSLTCASEPDTRERATDTTPLRLHYFFQAACDALPANLALVCGADRLSYAELDARANRLARHLIRIGVRPGHRVGLLLERSVHTYVALLAVLK